MLQRRQECVVLHLGGTAGKPVIRLNAIEGIDLCAALRSWFTIAFPVLNAATRSALENSSELPSPEAGSALKQRGKVVRCDIDSSARLGTFGKLCRAR